MLFVVRRSGGIIIGKLTISKMEIVERRLEYEEG